MSGNLSVTPISYNSPVRFFAHDGQTVHGPARVDELTKLPNFDGDTLVCPVGSENSADWKPALAYPPFRAVLLAPSPRQAPPPRPAAPPPPPPPTKPCPRCAHRNPESARFCNDCAARMDGREEPPAPAPVPVFVPAAEPSFTPEPPAPSPAPVETFASNPPYDLGLEPPAAAPAALEPPPPPPARSWRTPLIAAGVSALLASSAVGWWLLRSPAKKAAPGAELNLTPPAPSAPAPALESPQSAPISAPASAMVAPPVEPAAVPAPAPASSLPAATAPTAAKPAPSAATPKPAAAPRKPRRKRPTAFKPIRAAKEKAPAPEPPAEKPADTPSEPKAEPAKPAADAGGDDGFLLPGVPRRLPPKKAAAPKAAAPAAEPAAPDRAEDASTGQVREQFEFCSQLLSQGAYADHFDTCLCAGARQAAPYGGDRKKYAAAMKKLADAYALETNAAAGAIVLDGATAKVTAGKTVQGWALEDGLWCRAR